MSKSNQEHLRVLCARRLLLWVLFLLVLAGCGMKTMSGGFLGTATVTLTSATYYASAPTSESASDVLADLSESGNLVTLRFGNTSLLANCDLKASITNGTAYIIDGPVCESDVGGMLRTINIAGGSVAVGDYGDADVIIRVDGFTGVSNSGDGFVLDFRGKSKK